MREIRRGETREYWLARDGKYGVKSAAFAAEACARYEDFFEAMEEHGLADQIVRGWCHHHARDREGSGINTELDERGEEGVNIKVALNEFRAMVRQIKSILLGRKLTFTATSKTSNSEAMAATLKTRRALKHYEARGGFQEATELLVEQSAVMVAAWMGVTWDPQKGPEPVDVDMATGELKYSGDLAFPVYHSMQVAYDRRSPSIEDPNWLIVEVPVLRYELATAHPEHKDKILSMEAPSRMASISSHMEMLCEEDDDYLHILYVYGKRTPFLPTGRFAKVLDAETVLWDGALEESRIPVFPLMSSKEIGESGFPYGDFLDLLPVCELLQDAHSELASMFSAMVALIWTPEGATYELDDFGQLKRLRGGTEKPEVITLNAVRQEHYQYIAHLLEVAMRLAMISQAQTGDVNAADSGSKLAYMSSMSMEQHGGFIRRLVRVLEQALTMAVEILCMKMGDDPRVVSIIGRDGAYENIEFTKAELKLVSGVLIEQADPATTTPEFKRARADLAAQKDWVSSPGEWMTAFKLGDDAIITDDDIQQEVHVRRENERLRDGSAPVQAVELDQHMLHIKKHVELACEEMVRMDPAALHRLRAHVLEHIQHLDPASPQFMPQALLATGQQPLPSTVGPQGAMAPPEMQPPGAMGADQGPKGSPPAEKGLSGRAPEGPGPAGMPPAPRNPGTGQAAPTPALQGAPVPPGATSR